jgi:hypothetical protein
LTVRLFSNPASVRRGELSALAIAETIAASGLSFWLAWRLGSIQHIVLASALVPFLLLRTRLSTWYAVRLWKEIEYRPSLSDKATVAMLIVAAPCIKILATAKIFIRRPIKSVRAIPANFIKEVAVVDITRPLRVFPGSEELKGKFPNLDELQDYVFGPQEIKNPQTLLRGFIVWTLFGPTVALAWAYRWALKSTAFFWLPLIWIVIQARPGTQVMDRLVLMTRSAWSKTMRAYSALVLLAFFAKLALLFGIRHFANLDWLGQLGVAATRLVAPLELPLWQVAGAANAILAWLFFFHADQHLLAQGTSEAWPEVWVRREYASLPPVPTLALRAFDPTPCRPPEIRRNPGPVEAPPASADLDHWIVHGRSSSAPGGHVRGTRFARVGCSCGLQGH